MTYDELERFKIEADRWVAYVTADGSASSTASHGIRDIIQQVHDKASQSEADQRGVPPLDITKIPEGFRGVVWFRADGIYEMGQHGWERLDAARSRSEEKE